MTLLNIIEKIRKIDNVNNSYYRDVFDKYLNGECQTLVRFLYLLNNQQGTEIEIVGISEDIESDFDEKVYHYVYKYNNLYYDINGEFEDINELIRESCLFDYIVSIKEKQINAYHLENDKNFKIIKECLKKDFKLVKL